MRILGIGETVFDILFRDGRPLAAIPGGSTFNAMVSLGRTVGKIDASIDVSMVTRIGTDAVGDMIVSFMSENNLSLRYVDRVDKSQSILSIAMLNEKNDASYEFYRDSSVSGFRPSDIDFRPGDVVLFGSYFAIGPSSREATQRLVRKAKDSGAIIYYDINFRKSHLLELPETKKFIEDNCAMSDFVRGSSEDIGYLYGSSDAAEVYSGHISALCPSFICTKGADATEIFTPSLHRVYPVDRIKTVSTIGAGDNFNAGFLYALVKAGFSKERLSALSSDDWSCLVPTAHRFSSNVCRSLFNYVDEDFDPES